jgi:hypothetical protein
VWTDRTGIRAAALARRPARPGGPAGLLAPAQARLLIPVGPRREPRFPLAALSSGSGVLDVFWTADRRTLLHSAERPELPAGSANDGFTAGLDDAFGLPLDAAGGELLRDLTVTAGDPRSARLACLTDRGRVFTADWDLAFGLLGAWSALTVPVPDPASLAAVPVGDRPVLLTATARGHLLAADLRAERVQQPDWSSVALPEGIRPAPLRALAAASGGGRAWIAVLSDAGAWLATLEERAGYFSCGPAVPLRWER